MNEHLLSIATDEDGTQAFMHLDLAGVNYLLKELGQMKEQLEKNDCSHLHMFTEEWGGGELTSSKLHDQEDEKKQVHHLKIYGWNDEWKVKHKLVKL